MVAPDNRHLEDDIEEIELILQSGAISIPAQLVTSDERFLRLKFDEDIPVKVAINEAVELAKTYCDVEAKSFINALLAKLAD